MAITRKSIKLLWSNSAGMCAFPDCRTRLSVEQTRETAPYTLGEMAHIKGDKPGSNRYDEAQLAADRDDYLNLILLCPTHHTLVDKPENEAFYSVDILNRIKDDHEKFVSNRLFAEDIESVEQVKDLISTYMAQNKQAWEQYGPMSDVARKNPHSERVYRIWESERLSTIVPNNREIAKILRGNRKLFSRNQQITISKFIQHVDSYENWVNDQIPYSAVLRFPTDFEMLVFGE